MNRSMNRVAILNRGEAAMRCIHAIRERNSERDHQTTIIAFYTDPDFSARFVREADEVVCLGAAMVDDPESGESKSAYLDFSTLRGALGKARIDAVWAGWGFGAESPELVELCDDLGITFVGPDASAMRRLGDKMSAKDLAESLAIPVIPWSNVAVASLEEAVKGADRLRYPVMIKAVAGGGGRGIRRVESPDDLRDCFQRVRTEAFRSFGDPRVFLEKALPDTRHVEVQIVGDGAGTVWTLGVRDCTIQRRHQKIMEETPSPVLPGAVADAMRDAARRMGEAVRYRNAGTVEFLYDPGDGGLYFMEFNARLQVEHPITEMTTGYDIVKLQFHIAEHGELPGAPPEERGHAIEVRLNAEDVAGGFVPAPGRLVRFRIPSGPGIRVDSGYMEGDTIPAVFDSMIAKVIAHGATREEALSRLRRALAQTTVLVEGGMSNKGFLLRLLHHPDVVAGATSTTWLESLAARGEHLSWRYADVALLQAAIEMYTQESRLERSKFFHSAHRGRPHIEERSGIDIKLIYRGNRYDFRVYRQGAAFYRVDIDGRSIAVQSTFLGESEWRVVINDTVYRVFSLTSGQPYQVEVNGYPHLIRLDQGGIVRAPAPAVVVKTAVAVGDRVRPGDTLAILEAMKMEMVISATFGGTVKEIMAVTNRQVHNGAPLMLIAPDGQPQVSHSGPRVEFSALIPEEQGADNLKDQCRENADALRRVLLGFDVAEGDLRRIFEERARLCVALPGDDPELRERENDILAIFTDIIALFRREPTQEEMESGARLSSEEYFFSYLQNTAAGEEGLPESFLRKLRGVLRHYDLERLDPSTELDIALFRMCKSHQRMATQLAPIISILERNLVLAEKGLCPNDRHYRALLNRMIGETQRRYSAINDLARRLHYVCFDKPHLDHVRRRVLGQVEEQLTALQADPDREDRAALAQQLVDCPQTIRPLLARHFATGDADMRRVILEIITRRYYIIRRLTDLHVSQDSNYNILTARYELDGRQIHLYSAHCRFEDLAAVAAGIDARMGDVPADADIVVDFFLWEGDRFESEESALSATLDTLNTIAFARPLRRLVVSIQDNSGEEEMLPGTTALFTFRQGEKGFYEERVYRGMHPLMAKRLEIWRLSNFDIERLPSAEDIYLFKAVARSDPRDERLFAFAEVRDLTPIRNGDGRLQLPSLELMLQETVTAIRQFQTPTRNWNRILLYVWPVFDVDDADLRGMVNRLAPSTAGVGLEKVVLRMRTPTRDGGPLEDTVLEISQPAGREILVRYRTPQFFAVRPLSTYAKKVVQLRRRGLVYPYELVRMLTQGGNGSTAFPAGTFQEYDLAEDGRLVAVDRPYGENTANIIVGVITNTTDTCPDGMTRVALFGDPSRAMGSLAEPECRRINAGLELAKELDVPLEWYACSAGAKIAMDSGTENMDWIALVLRRIVEFTQAGGEINVIVNGINVGAQPYWNAEATMLMHTRGILIMTPESAMVLTGKQALEYSGGVAAEDNQGIGGYERIMGPNGQAQYFAEDIGEACQILFQYYQHSYRRPGERFPRRAAVTDPADRDVCRYPHGEEFETVGDIFSDATNPGRKKPFNIRRVMQATIDQDFPALERWYGMQDAEIAVVWDAHVGGYPVAMIGMESRPLPRLGYSPADGPEFWTSGTLFPRASKKIARAINAASGNRPLVVLANLSGFDGSPESLSKWQLEFGAEIGRAVVNFRGPIVFCVISRYHGGAFVVFSNALHDNMEVVALEGSHASVIGGAPAAAVVFAREVKGRTIADARLATIQEGISAADPAEKARLRTHYNEVFQEVYSEKLGEVAEEFDSIHSVERAQRVGSVDTIIPPERLRPYLIEALERGMEREMERWRTARISSGG